MVKSDTLVHNQKNEQTIYLDFANHFNERQ